MTLEGIIFNLEKFAIHDGPGIRTTVFMKGCPLDCWWCHNPEGRKTESETISVQGYQLRDERFGRKISVHDLMHEIKKDDIFYRQSGGGVTFSGGEPMLQSEFIEKILLECRRNYISTAIDTCGFVPFVNFERIFDLVDLFLYDIKIMDDELHQKYTGVSNRLILENIRKLSEMKAEVIIRLPLIPGFTDDLKNIVAIGEFLLTLGHIKNISLLPYNRLGEDKRRRFNMENNIGHLPEQNKNRIAEIRDYYKSLGLNVRVGG